MNEITLTVDTIVHTAGCRLYVPDSTVTLIDTKACAELIEKLTESEAVAMQKQVLDQMRLELKAANAAIDDLNVQCKFWRQAAEHAVTGWNALEEKTEAAKEALNAIEGNLDAARELLGGLDEWAPPSNEVVARMVQDTIDNAIEGKKRVDLGYYDKLHIVEEETLLECAKPAPTECPSLECSIRELCTGSALCNGVYKKKEETWVVVAVNEESRWSTVASSTGRHIDFHSTSYNGKSWPYVGARVDVTFNNAGAFLAVHEKD